MTRTTSGTRRSTNAPTTGPTATAAADFATTRWTLVLSAGQAGTPAAHAALESLCRIYWYPLYAFIRRQGRDTHDAQDLTQAFFARLLEKNYLDQVSPEKGKFRSFLLACLKHFLANEWDRRRAQKRGGALLLLSIDAADAERRYGLEPAHGQTPEALFERRWALTLLDRVLEMLRTEFVAAGKGTQFDQLKEGLTVDRHSLSYAALGARLGLREGAVKVAVHRLRRRYRELLRAEIAHTVSIASEVDEELRHLFAVLGGSD